MCSHVTPPHPVSGMEATWRQTQMQSQHTKTACKKGIAMTKYGRNCGKVSFPVSLWEEDRKGKGYRKIQRSVSIKNYRERTGREEIIMTRLRVDHTGLNGTLFLMGKRNSENCENWG